MKQKKDASSNRVYQKPATINQQSTNPWKTLSSSEKYSNPWIEVTEYQVLNPSGKPGIYGKVHFKNKAIGIIALDKKLNTWLVGQFRFTVNEWSWEIPEGGGPLNTDVLTSAKRELKEETGLTAKKWKLIQRVHLSNSVSDEEGFIFLAQNLSEGIAHREDTEADMKVWKLPFKKALKMVLEGEITDSLSVVGILKGREDFEGMILVAGHWLLVELVRMRVWLPSGHVAGQKFDQDFWGQDYGF